MNDADDRVNDTIAPILEQGAALISRTLMMIAHIPTPRSYATRDWICISLSYALDVYPRDLSSDPNTDNRHGDSP